MSNHLTSEVYKRQVGNIARKAVMVLMADKASDDGSGIWASKQRMADEIGASKQTVIATIKALIEDGLLREHGQRRCANGYTVEYAINVRALRSLPLVKSHADDQSENLTGQAASPVKRADPTGQSPLPHRSENLTQTTLEPSLNLSDASHPQDTRPPAKPSRKTEPKAKPVIPDWMPADAWNGYLEMRKGIGKAPTDYAISLMIGKLERWRADGHDPATILNTATECNWTGLYEPKENRNGNSRNNAGPHHARNGGRPKDGAIAALDRKMGLDGGPGEPRRYDDRSGPADRRPALAGPRRLF